MDDSLESRASVYEISAWIMTGLTLWLVFPLHLFLAAISGLLVYELVHIAAPLLRITKISHGRAKMLVVGLLAALIVASLILIIWKAILFFRLETTNLSVLLQKMADVIDGARSKLPHWVAGSLPANVEDINKGVTDWLRAHAAGVQAAGKGIGLAAAHILIGMVIGAIVSLSDASESHAAPPLAAALTERVRRISEAFRAVVFAQVRISALNTFFTFLYLGVALPLMDIHLPFLKTMIALTFIIGLLPVVGNLISNCIIIVVSLSLSSYVALSSFGFLVVIHKLEYFLNARIVGGQIRAKTWELLLAMLIMEAAFGISGVAAAPIYYAYIKKELADRGLV